MIHFRKKLSLILACTVSASLISSCGTNTAQPQTTESQTETTQAAKENKRSAFAAFTNELFLDRVKQNTLDLHYLVADPAAMGIEDYPVTLGTYSQSYIESELEKTKDQLKQLQQFKRSTLTDSEKITYDVLNAGMSAAIEAEDFPYYDEALKPSIGLPAELPILLAEYAFRSETDITDYLGLLADMDRYYGELLVYEQEKADAGLFMSDTVCDMVLDDCAPYLTVDEDSVLIVTFKERLEALSFLTDEQKADYIAQNEELVKNDVAQAYQLLNDGLTKLKGSGTNEYGLAFYDKGPEYYKYLLKTDVGIDISPEDLEELIIEQVNSDLTETFDLLDKDSSLASKMTAETSSFTDPYEILSELQKQMADDFPALTGDVNVTIKYVSQALEDSLSPAFYLTPPVDCLNDNVIYINGGSTDDNELFTTLAHEGYPGHLYQAVYSGNYTDDDPVRRLCDVSGYTEGWAEYVENLAYYYDSSMDSDLQSVNQHYAFANLGIYALLDIYIHYDGLTREEVYDWLASVFTGIDESSADEMYNMILSQPTNYLNYYVGALEFMSLRDQAKAALKKNFSLKDFHAFILETGNVPFYLLEDYLSDWIKARD